MIPPNKRKKYSLEFDEYELDWVIDSLKDLFDTGGCFRGEYDGDEYVDGHRIICEQLLDRLQQVKPQQTL